MVPNNTFWTSFIKSSLNYLQLSIILWKKEGSKQSILPPYLKCWKVCVYWQSSQILKYILITIEFSHQLLADSSRPSIVPHYRVHVRLTSALIPSYSRLSLICDANSLNVANLKLFIDWYPLLLHLNALIPQTLLPCIVSCSPKSQSGRALTNLITEYATYVLSSSSPATSKSYQILKTSLK